MHALLFVAYWEVGGWGWHNLSHKIEVGIGQRLYTKSVGCYKKVVAFKFEITIIFV